MTAKTVYTPLGSLVLSEHENHIVNLDWNPEHHLNSSPVLEQAAEEIQAYLRKDLTDFAVPTKFLVGTPFQRKVWQAIAEIPYGETVTYNDIAQDIKSSPRAVGTACGKNPLPLIIPCHRVVGASGKLTGYSGGDGTLTKRVLLDFEKKKRSDIANLVLWQALREQLPQKPFYFMRHGQTDYNLKEIIQGGLIDSSLNKTGLAQATTAGKKFSSVFNPEYVWHSSLQRTRQTLDQVLAELPEKKRTVGLHPGLNERSFGLYEGKPSADMEPMRSPFQCSPEGESWLRVVTRLSESLNHILENSAETPLVVSHGFTARILGDFLGCWSSEKRFKNCEILYVEPPKSGKPDQPWSSTEIHAGE